MNALAKAAVASTVVCLCGFGAMFTLHLVLTPVHGLPDLFDFVSATWGDGLALPIMAGALVYAIVRSPAVRGERVVAMVMGVLGGLLGAGTQILWLLDDAPRGNWTFPRPHHFNAAGWYHAAFLTLMSATTAILWTLALRRLAHRAADRAPDRARVVAVGIALLAAVSFAVLLALDAAPNPITASSAATIVATTAGSLALLIALFITGAHALRRQTSSTGSTSARRR